MATRFYLRENGSAPVSVTVDGGWESSASPFASKPMFTTTDAGDALTTVPGFGSTTGQDRCHRQWISQPMDAGITFDTGVTYKCYVQALESAANDNIRSRMGVRIVSEDGSTVRHTILAIADYSTATEWNTALRNKAFANGDAGTGSYVTVAGDRLVVEIGHNDSAGSSISGSSRWGSAGTADLGENETSVSTTERPWFETSVNITFVQPTPPDESQYEPAGGCLKAASLAAAKFATAVALTAQLAAGFNYNDAPVAQQATRFYPTVHVTNTPGVDVEYDSSWSSTIEGRQFRLQLHKDGPTGFGLGGNTGGGSVGASHSRMLFQLVSAPMRAGVMFSTTDRIKAQVHGIEDTTDSNIVALPASLRIYSENGTTFRVTLKSWAYWGPSVTEWPLAFTNRTIFDGDFLDKNYTTQEGDRLVLEFGVTAGPSGSTDFSGSINLHATEGEPDLPENETETDAFQNSWFEISRDVEFRPFEDGSAPRLQTFWPWVAPLVIEPSNAASPYVVDEDFFFPPVFPWRDNYVYLPVDGDVLVEQAAPPEIPLDDGWYVPASQASIGNISWTPRVSDEIAPVAVVDVITDDYWHQGLVQKSTNLAQLPVDTDNLPPQGAIAPALDDGVGFRVIIGSEWTPITIVQPSNGVQNPEAPAEPTPPWDYPVLKLWTEQPWVSPLIIQSEPYTDVTVVPPQTPVDFPDDGGRAVALGPELWWTSDVVFVDAADFVAFFGAYQETEPPLPLPRLWPISTKVFTDTDTVTRIIGWDDSVPVFPRPVQWLGRVPFMADEFVQPIPFDAGDWRPTWQQPSWFPRLIVDDSDLVVATVTPLAHEEDAGPLPRPVWNYTLPSKATWGDDSNEKITPEGVIDEQYYAPSVVWPAVNTVFLPWSQDEVIHNPIDEQYWHRLQWSLWPVPPLVVANDTALVFAQNLIDEVYDHPRRQQPTIAPPQVVLDDDVIVEQPALVPIVEDYWFNPAPWLARQPSAAQALADDDVVATHVTGEAVVEGMAVEVLYIVPPQPVRVTKTDNSFVGKGPSAPPRITTLYTQFGGIDDPEDTAARMTHLHVEGVGEDVVKSAHMTFLHVQIMRAKVPQPPEPPEPCPTTVYECAIKPATAYMCIVVPPMVCEGLAPEVRIVPDELPCPPIEGEPLPGSTLEPLIRQLNDVGEIMYLLKRPSSDSNRLLDNIDTDALGG